MEVLKLKPTCLGKLMEVDSRNCSTCPYRIECYELFRKHEKELEQLKQRCKMDWYKMDTSTSSLTCSICG